MKHMIRQCGCAGLLLLAAYGNAALAQNSYADEYSKLIKSAQVIKAEGPTLFGDSVNLYTGAINFATTDVSLSGNNALRVAVGRRFELRSDYNNFAFSDWDIDLPYIGGVFGQEKGWAVSLGDGAENRCSSASAPVAVKTQVGTRYITVESWKFWDGYQLFTPDGGEQEVLVATTESNPRPSSGAYPWVTKQFWYLSCLPALKSGHPGEGFLAHAPDGTKYYFDWMVKRTTIGVLQPFLTEGTVRNAPLLRDEIRIYPTRVEDRHGNWVKYTWTGSQLNTIESNDGRKLSLTWETTSAGKSRITSVADNGSGRTWRYAYAPSGGYGLTTVTLPDQSAWEIDFSKVRSKPHYDEAYEPAPGRPPGGGQLIHVQDKALDCSWMRVLDPVSDIATIRHPTGALGEFELRGVRNGRTQVTSQCLYPPSDQLPGEDTPEDTLSSKYPARYDTNAIRSKRISGIGLTSQTWNYQYVTPIGGWSGLCNGCPTTKTTTVTGPGGERTVHTYGVVFAVNEGQLLKTELFQGSTLLQATTNTYLSNASAPNQPFPDRIGISPQDRQDSFTSERLRPTTAAVTTRDGETFSWQANSFDQFAKPATVTKSGSLGYARTEVMAYHDNLAKWIVGQIKTVTCTAPAACKPTTAPNGIVMSQTDYDATTALPLKTYAYGKLQQTLTYNADGTVATVKDGNNSVTTLSSWKLGIPQKITYPATTDQPTPMFESAVVNADGTLASVTDEAGSKTCYDYDAMGRLAGITYPSEAQAGVCDTSTYAKTTLSFQDGYPAAAGLPANHWRQIVQTGQGRKTILFDALWRPVLEQSLELTDIDNTRSEVAKQYDASGRLAFQSYPIRAVTNVADPALKGTKTEYDALDRVTFTRQNWENDATDGPLVTKTEYLTGFQTWVTDPNGKQTTTDYMAWDQPTTDYPLHITHPEGAYTDIGRDTFGKPVFVRRHNADNGVRITRYLVYNAAQELCKSIEPETGSTVMHYDGAGNVDWSAAGLALNSITSCEDTDASIAARKVSRTYDARNRLKTLDFPDDSGNQVWIYTPDGLPATITAVNPRVTNPTKTTYTYNRRRLLTRETLQPLGGTTAWSMGYAYNANGHRSLMQYPTGLAVSLAPNSLGQQETAGAFANSVTYAPNGAIAGFTYGNGILHQLTQNVRGLPDRSLDISGSTHYLDDGYDYDGNGNVMGISDGRDASRRRTVDMTYDGLNRLLTASSKMFGNTGAAATIGYSYDVLDNLTRMNAPATANAAARNHYYCYTNGRLDFVRTGAACTGTTSPAAISLTYDVQGNVESKNSTTYDFDFGNRMRTSPGMWYAYDGMGRRVLSCTSSACGYSFYSVEGPLLFTWDERSGKKTEYMYLGNSLVAERSAPLAGGTQVVQYQHTDALGSPVTVTNETKAVVAAEQAEYDPFGRLANRTLTDGPGYTGHVMDASTGLSYMQQRYYDPSIGRFLSVDPVDVDPKAGANFGRYKYASNNPYRFTDPDGRSDVNYFNRSDTLYDAADRFDIPGMTTVMGHSWATGYRNDQEFKPGRAVDYVSLRNDISNVRGPGRDQGYIFLGGCNLGMRDVSSQISKDFNTNVISSPSYVRKSESSSGDITYTPNTKADGTGSAGSFRITSPDGRVSGSISSITMRANGNIIFKAAEAPTGSHIKPLLIIANQKNQK